MTSIGDKAAHVRQAGQRAGGHTCHWPGCKTQCKPAFWGCSKHWFTLPAALRTKVFRCYEIGQEVSARPSAEYVEVAREVEAWALKYETDRAAFAKSRREGDLFNGS